MNSLEYLAEIKRYFMQLIVEIKCNNACDHFDINKVAENFFMPILSIIFDCPDIENQNVIRPNFPSVDLGSKSKRLSFQVTSDPSSAKVVYTLEKFREHSLEKEFDEVNILVITEKQRSYTSEALKNEVSKHSIAFDPGAHIIDYTDLIARASALPVEKLLELCETLRAEFSRYSNYEKFKGDLDAFLQFSILKIEVEKNTKKYIPSIFTEPTKTKETTRIFAHPVFFGRKIEDKIREVNFDYLNNHLEKVGLPAFQSEILPVSDADFPGTLKEVYSHLQERRRRIAHEASRVNPLSFQPKGTHGRYEVAPEKTAMYSMLKFPIEGCASSIEWKYDEALQLIGTAEAKCLLITSAAGQGKTNFICDLMENQFGKFGIPSVFIPARELNKYAHPNRILSFLNQNRYLPVRDSIQGVLEVFDQVASGIQMPFMIAIDGINEVKDLDGFRDELSDLLSAVAQYDFVKIIITCRTEFFDSKFSQLMNEPFSGSIIRIKDLKAEMSDESLKRMLASYLAHFKVDADLSASAAAFLKSDLLMMRIFCDLHEGESLGHVADTYKIKLYESYLYRKTERLPKPLRAEFLPSLYAIVDQMLREDRFHSVSVAGYSKDQLEVIDLLIAEDIILRREPAEKTLETMFDETVSFTYDELRDFVIAFYLVNRIGKADFSEFSGVVDRLRTLQVYEGVFKYAYLMARQKGEKQVLEFLEAAEDFDIHYSIAISTLPHEYQDASDRERVIKYLSTLRKREIVQRIGSFLFHRDAPDQVLNTRLLLEIINKLDDDQAPVFFYFLFNTRAHVASFERDAIKDFLSSWNKDFGVKEELDDLLVFVIQLSFLADAGLKYDLRETLDAIRAGGEFEDCFAFVEQAKCGPMAAFARAIEGMKIEKSEVSE